MIKTTFALTILLGTTLLVSNAFAESAEIAKNSENDFSTASLVAGGTKADSPGNTATAASTATAIKDVNVETAAVKDEKKVDTAKLSEAEIPVFAGAKDAKKSDTTSFHKIVITLFILLLTLAATTFGLKRWASKGKGKSQSTQIKILTQHHLGPKKSLAIIQVAGEALLIGITDQNISMLKTLSLLDEEIPEHVPRDFNQTLGGYTDDDFNEKREEKSSNRNQKSAPVAAREPEDFAMRGIAEIRDVVSSRLKNMRNF